MRRIPRDMCAQGQPLLEVSTYIEATMILALTDENASVDTRQ